MGTYHHGKVHLTSAISMPYICRRFRSFHALECCLISLLVSIRYIKGINTMISRFIRKSGKMRQMNETWLPCCVVQTVECHLIHCIGSCLWSYLSPLITTERLNSHTGQAAMAMATCIVGNGKTHFNLELKLSSWLHTCSNCSGLKFKNYTHLFPFPREYAVIDQSSWLLDATSTCSCETSAKYNEKCTKY